MIFQINLSKRENEISDDGETEFEVQKEKNVRIEEEMVRNK